MKHTRKRVPSEVKPGRGRNVTGWIAVALGTLFSSLWAFWGAIENFHEGWCYGSLWDNLLALFIQYIGLAVVFTLLTALAIRWPRVGGTLFTLLALLFTSWVFATRDNLSLGVILSWLPGTVLGVGVGVLFFLGRPHPRKWALRVAILVPLLTALISGAYPAYLTFTRIPYEHTGPVVVEGNGVTLTWAGEGEGWVDRGTSWDEAMDRAARLDSSGTVVTDSVTHLWRLPTVAEAVACAARHGRNSGGTWDGDRKQAQYSGPHPDKEPPLWDGERMMIYMWTATEVDSTQAYMMIYDGRVYPRNKRNPLMGFRAVKTR